MAPRDVGAACDDVPEASLAIGEVVRRGEHVDARRETVIDVARLAAREALAWDLHEFDRAMLARYRDRHDVAGPPFGCDLTRELVRLVGARKMKARRWLALRRLRKAPDEQIEV